MVYYLVSSNRRLKLCQLPDHLSGYEKTCHGRYKGDASRDGALPGLFLDGADRL